MGGFTGNVLDRDVRILSPPLFGPSIQRHVALLLHLVGVGEDVHVSIAWKIMGNAILIVSIVR